MHLLTPNATLVNVLFYVADIERFVSVILLTKKTKG